MKLYLIRHGQTDWNVAGKIQGSHDIPLNGTGRAQAGRLAMGMDKRPVTRIFSSTLSRAVETARELADRQQVDIYLMPSLIEIEFGSWEGLTWEEIKDQYPEEFERWNMNPVDVAPPGGETRMDVVRRCAASLKTILEVTGGREDVAVVSHGATIAYLISYMMREHSQETEIIVENASITTVDYDPLTQKYQVTEMNDTSHRSE